MLYSASNQPLGSGQEWPIQGSAAVDTDEGEEGHRQVCNACLGMVSSCISPRHGTPADGARVELGLIVGPRARGGSLIANRTESESE